MFGLYIHLAIFQDHCCLPPEKGVLILQVRKEQECLLGMVANEPGGGTQIIF